MSVAQISERRFERALAHKRLDHVGVRLQIASKLFSHFAKARRQWGIDSDSQQILFAFKLAGLAEACRDLGAQGLFQAEIFSARLNASTIANMTGIPRETVRRKLIKLCSAGLLVSEANGAYLMDRYWPDLDIVEMLGWLVRE